MMRIQWFIALGMKTNGEYLVLFQPVSTFVVFIYVFVASLFSYLWKYVRVFVSMGPTGFLIDTIITMGHGLAHETRRIGETEDDVETK
jgi:hypothetical protein